MPYLAALLYNLLGVAVGRLLIGAGLGLVTFAVAAPLVLSALNAAASGFNNLAADMLSVMLIAGLGEVLTILGSAMMTRLALNASRVALAKRR